MSPGPDDLETADDLEAPADERIEDDRPKHTPVWAAISGFLLAAEAWLRSHGGRPLQYGIRGFWMLVAGVGVFLLLGPVINKPLTLDDITDSASSATEQWIARKFAADFTVTRASDGTLRVDVEERIDALFPKDVEERGIERVLATNYQGHDLQPEDISATLDGREIAVQRTATADRLTLSMMGDEVLQGDHSYVLRYTLHHLAYESTDEASGTPIDMLEWDVFGPSWGIGFAAFEVAVILPDEIDERLIRQPRGALAWTLLGAGQWLTPEGDSPPGTVRYVMSNEQNIPPHANAWFTLPFEAGTFAMPPKSTLWWVQTYGPLAPLGFLAVTLILALAARAVAWSDARGRPWFVAQSEPPPKVSPRLAAHILESPRAFELATALQGGDQRKIARAAVRAGRLSDLVRALTRYRAAREGREQYQRGLRRIPHGFVRDLFIAAPLAITVVQWGLVRQLSHQAKLAVVWWPVAFVLVSTVIAIVILLVTRSAHPLTEKGALLRQHLLGIGAYARRTTLLDRTTTRDALLPYVVLLESPRAAGHNVARMLAVEGGNLRAARDPDAVTRPRMLARGFALLLVAASVVFVSTTDTPYTYGNDATMYWGNVPGASAVTVRSFEASAELSRSDEGHARLDVTQRITAEFDGDSSRVPQFVQQWPAVHDRQNVGLAIESVRIDGRDVPHEVTPEDDTILLVTRLLEVLDGEHEVIVEYSLSNAETAAEGPDGTIVDRVRWGALLDGWEHNSTWDPDEGVDPFTVGFVVPEDLLDSSLAAGWSTLDTSASDDYDGWTEAAIPFGEVETLVMRPGEEEPPDPDDVTSETTRTDGDRVVHTLQVREGEYGHVFELGLTDLGVMLDFPADTFAGGDESALRAVQAEGSRPIWMMIVLAAVAVGLALLPIVGGPLRTGARRSGLLRDIVRWVVPAAALASCILFFWAVSEMAGDDPAITPIGISLLVSIAAATAALIVTRRRAPKGSGAARRPAKR